MRKIELEITNDYDGYTLYDIFTKKLKLSGYLIRRNKSIYNAVTINGNHATVRSIVHSGDILSVLIGDMDCHNEILPCEGNLDIIYEDEDIIVLNKKANEVVHPDHAHNNNTLSNYLKHYYIQNNISANIHPVNRLDNGTSGLVFFAKNAYAQNNFRNIMNTNSFSKTYLAICSGKINENQGIINEPILRISQENIKRCVCSSGLESVTEYAVIKKYDNMTFIRVTPHTGRTHQIRVHMSYIGHPLIGDRLYGGYTTQYMTRQALHSYRADFIHPVTNKHMMLIAPLADDMKTQLKNISSTQFNL